MNVLIDASALMPILINKPEKMKVYNYSQARQNFTSVLNTALREEVEIQRKDGSRFKIVPIIGDRKEKSPLEGIIGIEANVTTAELLEIIREGREGRDYFKEKY